MYSRVIQLYICIYIPLYIYVYIHIYEEGMATHSSILAWEKIPYISLVGYSPWGQK